MGEVAISSYEEVGKMEDEKKRKQVDDEVEEISPSSTVKRRKRSDCSGLMVRWERLIPTMASRILLVEADDSTRQIIAALLRKCSYKVAAVSDGLKAWEIIKGKPKNIDLILTEVDLPSISGYALLTLIMEHELCKRIPVIMMSAHDSVSAVYKCMLRGAADYLVKPIRRNELRNLWQHVWRRQSALAGVNGPSDEQDKVEATSENNTASIHSSRDLALIQNNKECIEKGSDAQSSCTKPDAEGESSHIENLHDCLQPVWGNDTKKQSHELAVHENRTEGSAAANRPESQRVDYKITLDAGHNNVVPVIEAIDFMGTSACHNLSIDTAKSKFQFPPHLDLCLTGCSPSGFEIQGTEEKCTLRQSNASAFSLYTGRNSTMGSTYQKELEAKSVEKFSGVLGGTDTSIISLANGQIAKPKYPQQRVVTIPNSSNGRSLDNLYASISPCFGKQVESNTFYQSTWRRNSEKFESLEDRGHISPTTDQSTTSSLCNGGASQLNIGYRSTSGSNSNFDHVDRSAQREAALNKFRLKRKDRCFEKKVRYESRKKLAEQRPRVKGQFVRLPVEIDHENPNSLDG